MKIVVIGNCQCESFATWARAAVPDAEATTIHIQHLDDPVYEDDILARLACADVVAFQTMELPRTPSVRTALHMAEAKTIRWPAFGFDGFHPDIRYYPRPGGGHVQSAMFDYNSAIVATGYAAGLGVEHTIRLFNGLSYARLGYFDAYPSACRAAAEWLGRFAIDGDAMLLRWSEAGPFMHTANHPAIRVVADIADHCLSRAGIATLPVDHRELKDPLIDCQWPVYPELAYRIGMAGSLDFYPGRPGAPMLLSLEDLIRGSFAAYDALPRGTLTDLEETRVTARRLRLDDDRVGQPTGINA